MLFFAEVFSFLLAKKKTEVINSSLLCGIGV